MSEYLSFKSIPSVETEGKQVFVIAGAGIIGCCTAYYIVTHPKYDPEKHHIIILESKRVAGGASGKAGGLLALWAFPSQIVPLSFGLHQELSDKYDGEKEWGYRRLHTVQIEGDLSGIKDDEFDDEDDDEGQVIFKNEDEETNVEEPTRIKESSSLETDASSVSSTERPPKKFSRRSNHSQKTPKGNKLPKGLNWINPAVVTNCSTLGDTDNTAQVHPYKFTNFMLKKAVELSKGSIELILGKVIDIEYDYETGSAIGVNYEPTSIKETEKMKSKNINVRADKIIMTVGPWTSKVLPDCPISGLRAHSITVAPFKDQPVTPYAIFTEFKLNSTSYTSPEIYARPDEVYCCGEGDSAVDVPETTDDVEVVAAKCDELFNQVSKFSPNLRKGHILKRQACYLPVLDVPSSSGPLIGETNVTNLYLCSGHSCWGINNAPGSGKIMSELILDGKCKSAKINSLDPSLYFDASILVDDEQEDSSENGEGSEDGEDGEEDEEKADN